MTKEMRHLLVGFAIVIVAAGVYAWMSYVQQYNFSHLPHAEQQRQLAEKARADEMARQARSLRERTEQELKAAAEYEALEDDIHRKNAEECVRSARKYLPGWFPSDEAIARIEADCAEREARARARE